MNLHDFDREMAACMGREPIYSGCVEFHQQAGDIAAAYVAAHDGEDVIDSCDVMAWLGLGDEDDASRWGAIERGLLAATQHHYAHDCQWCGGDGESNGRRCGACHGSGDEMGAWAPRIVIGNSLVGGHRVICGWCGANTGDGMRCVCGVSLRRPLELVEALRMSVAGAANDGVGGAA